MLGMSFQSYRSTQSMKAHLLQMASHAENSKSLTTKAATDTTAAESLHAQSVTEATEAQELEDSAALLKEQAEQDAAKAIEDTTEADSYVDTIGVETAQVSALQAKIASEEVIYKEEIEKAAVEESSASSNTVKTESDGLATSVCEFIPLVDIFCDFVGGVAALAFESNAGKLTAEAALDYTAAVTTKSQEDIDVAELDSLKVQSAQNEEIAASLESEGKGKQLKSQQEEAQAEEQLNQATEKQTLSEEEELQSKEEISSANEEEIQAEKELDQSLFEDLQAFKDAIITGLLSTVVIFFFGVQLFGAIVIPGVAAVVGFIPYVIQMYSMHSSTRSDEWGSISTTDINSKNSFSVRLFLYYIWIALPRREIIYFMLHCGIFISTMSSFWFCARFEIMDSFDVRSKGATLLAFSVIASIIQGFLLHAIPYCINKTKEVVKNSEEHISWSLLLSVVIGTISKLIKAIIHLAPLFLIEATLLWLLYGKSIFIFNLPPPLSSINVSVPVVIISIIYVLLFEISHTHYDNCDSGLIKGEIIKFSENSDNMVESEDHFDDESKYLLQVNQYHRQQYDGGEDDSIEGISKDDIEFSHSMANDTVSNYSLQRKVNLSYRNEISIKNDILPVHQPSTSFNAMKASLDQFITALKLPFEILIITCMIILLQGSMPILTRLLPGIIKGHKLFFMKAIGILVGISCILWYILKINGNERHIRLWTGDVLRS